jgi:glycine/D-amino acid oxidase-like deaminating enzyme
LKGERHADVAIIGGGFTGVSAALALAGQGVRVIVLEAREFGWGASGRNGGFCCLGGSKAQDEVLDRNFGRDARLAYRRAEKQAIGLVETLVQRYAIDVDRHSVGETSLAHRPKHMDALRRSAAAVVENYGVEPEFIEAQDLAGRGMAGGPFFGAMTTPLGFGLNPRKYLSGLERAADGAGAGLSGQSPVLSWSRASGRHRLETPTGVVLAEQVIVATNGYSSENVPGWMSARYMPAQSTVIVTRPLSEQELAAQGWTSDQMSYDTRNLLHYFRLMPDRRFLFGMRGGLMTGHRAEAAARARTRADFERMFPAWAHVESPNSWSGLVCLARNRLPFVGSIPSDRGVWAAMCYHGNGVAMGSYAGHMVAGLVMNSGAEDCPEILRRPLARFPLGPFRRMLMPAVYAGLAVRDRF